MAINKSLFVNIGEGLSLMVGLPLISTWKTKGRPPKAKRGTLGFNTQTNKLEYFNGKDWFEATLNRS